MDTKSLTAEEIQGYLACGVLLLPSIYEHMLVQLSKMEHNDLVCLLPISIFDLYHIRLKKKLVFRIEQYQQQTAKRKAA